MVVQEEKPKVGDVYIDLVGEFRIMAIAEGYFMARCEGAMPFVAPIKHLINSVTILPKRRES